MARRFTAGSELDMTPMIDVVFQLIIFFIVTIQMEDASNPDIELDMAVHAPIIEKSPPTTTILEVDRRGRISMQNATIPPATLHNLLVNKYRKYGEFPILIRGDGRARHSDIRRVMDICTGAGLWKINFVAIKEKKAKRH